MRLPRRVGDAAELRKSLKPLLEKRRRARINESLSQLKGLVLPLLGAETSRYSKLEKADILEMTVRFLQEQPTSPYSTSVSGPLDSYLEGYLACLARLARVLPACSILEPAVSARLLEHLRQRPVNGGPPSQTPTPAPAPAPSPQQARRSSEVRLPCGFGGTEPRPDCRAQAGTQEAAAAGEGT